MPAAHQRTIPTFLRGAESSRMSGDAVPDAERSQSVPFFRETYGSHSLPLMHAATFSSTQATSPQPKPRYAVLPLGLWVKCASNSFVCPSQTYVELSYLSHSLRSFACTSSRT